MRTNVHFVIDASGSMGPQVDDVIGGFNQYVASLKRERLKREADYRLSAILFNTQVDPLFANVPLTSVPKLTRDTYIPGGGTALLDAVGRALDEIRGSRLQRRASDRPYGNGTEKHLVVIMTDGQENSSVVYSNAAIRGKIERRQETGWWTFVFLGADASAWDQGSKWGIPSGNTTWTVAANTGATWSGLASATSNYSASVGTTTQTYVADYMAPAGVPVETTTVVAAPPKRVVRRKK